MDNSIVGTLFALGIGAVVLAVVALLIREIVCWYLKLNELVKTLKGIETVLRNIDTNFVEQHGVIKQLNKNVADGFDGLEAQAPSPLSATSLHSS